MRKRKEKIELTEKEEELIRAIRNYQKSFPNGYPQLLYYIQHLVDELTDHPVSYTHLTLPTIA